MDIDIKTKGRQVNQTDFQSMWDGSSDLVVDPSTGLPLGRVEVPKTANQVSRFVFVKDTDSGAICCYIQPRLKVENVAGARVVTPTSNGHFVRGVEVKVISGKDVIKISETDSKMTDYTVPVAPGVTDNLVTGLTNMCDVSKNPNLGDVYSHIKSHFSLGLIAGGGVGGALAGVTLPDTVKKIQLAPESRLAHPIKTITKTRRVDTPDAYLVVAPHPNATKAERGGKALYYMPSLKKSSGDNIDIKSSSEILANGGLVVHRIRYDRNGEMKIDYYKDANSRAHFSIKATDPQIGDPTYGIEAWTGNFGVGDDGFDNPKAVELKHVVKDGFMDTYHQRRVLKTVVAGIIALGIVVTAIVAPVKASIDRANSDEIRLEQEYNDAYESVPNESAAAEADGAQKMKDLIAQNKVDSPDQATLLNYNVIGNTVSVSVGGIYNVVKTPINPYIQSVLVEFEGEQIGGDKYDYTLATLTGAFKELGRQVAQEASDNGVIVATRENSDSNAVINYIYGVVDPLSPTAALSDESKMTEFVRTLYADAYDYSGDLTLDQVVSTIVKSYTEGFKEKATQLALENPGIIIDDSERPVVDYENAELKSAVATTIAKLTETGKKYSAEDINIAYSSHGEKVLFANTTDGTYLFKIDLTNGGTNSSEITSTEDMISRINSADNCEESVKIDVLLKRLKLDKAIENLKTTYANENGVSDPQIYITGHSVLTQSDANPNQFEISPKMVIVSNNAGRIEEKPAYTVKVDAGKDASINQMVAVAVFGDAVADKYPIYIRVENTEEKNVVYEDNDLDVNDEANAQLENVPVNSQSSSLKNTGEKEIEL